MRLSHRLVRHAAGTYHFRLIVPGDLRERLGRLVIKRSLRTTDAHTALAAALALSARYAQLFAWLRGGGMGSQKFDPFARPPSDPAGDFSTYVVDTDKGVVQTDGSAEEHARALEMTRALTELRRASVGTAVSTTVPSPGHQPTASRKTLREAITYWETVDMGAMRLRATAEERRKTIEDFAAHVGEKRYITDLRRPDVASWVAHLRGTKKNHQSTAKKLSGHIKAFFDSARRAGFYPEELSNPAAEVVKFTKADQEDRAATHGWQAFTPEQLKTIFAPENFRRTREIHTRRAMVIALYTGARVGEIAQMRLSGFSTVGGRPVMSFDGELKADASRRRVPIHPALIDLGLLDWVSEQRKRGCTRLFPTVKLDGKSGKGNAISKGFSKLLDTLEVKPTIDADLALTKELNPKIGMHSFRDTIIQAMQGYADEELRKAYVGHSHEGKRPRPERMKGSHETAYMRAWTTEEISRVFSGIQWRRWLDIDRLRDLLNQSDEQHAQSMKMFNLRSLAQRKVGKNSS